MNPTPTVNVNLKPCTCGLADRSPTYPPSPHQDHCSAKPVLIPCPIQRTVTLKVALGECNCLPGFHAAATRTDEHAPSCPTRPVSVTCTIGGETWAESEVIDAGVYDLLDPQAALARLRARWEIVKALVLNSLPTRGHVNRHGDTSISCLGCQRDAVFAAIAGMSRAEGIIHARQGVIGKVVGLPWFDGEALPISTRALERSVQYFIATVGALP